MYVLIIADYCSNGTNNDVGFKFTVEHPETKDELKKCLMENKLLKNDIECLSSVDKNSDEILDLLIQKRNFGYIDEHYSQGTIFKIKKGLKKISVGKSDFDKKYFQTPEEILEY